MTIDGFHSLFSGRFFPSTQLCFEYPSGCCAQAVVVSEGEGAFSIATSRMSAD